MTQFRRPVPILVAPICIALLALLATACPMLASAQDGGRYARDGQVPSAGEWEWTFPDYVGNVGLTGSMFHDFDEFNGQVGVFYRHLESINGPLYIGFRIAPFSMGSVYDDEDYPGLYSWSSQAEFVVRFYTDLAVPEFYVEAGAGIQYTRFTTADDLADITENGYTRDSFGRWRGTFRLTIGIEFDVFGIEIGYNAIFPKISMDYTTYIPTDPIHTVEIGGMLYFGMYFRFDA